MENLSDVDGLQDLGLDEFPYLDEVFQGSVGCDDDACFHIMSMVDQASEISEVGGVKVEEEIANDELVGSKRGRPETMNVASSVVSTTDGDENGQREVITPDQESDASCLKKRPKAAEPDGLENKYSDGEIKTPSSTSASDVTQSPEECARIKELTTRLGFLAKENKNLRLRLATVTAENRTFRSQIQSLNRIFTIPRAGTIKNQEGGDQPVTQHYLYGFAQVIAPESKR